MKKSRCFDYIIVGAGSAGCVLANRLSADPACRVLLLEAGGRDWHPLIHMPAGIGKLAGSDTLNWGFYTEAEAQLNNRRMYWPRGRVLGGSSSINAMCYARGHRLDYQEWSQSSGEDWNWNGVLPYFRRSASQPGVANELKGTDGPLSVEVLRHHNPLSEVFISAAVNSGYDETDDFNGEEQLGVGFYQVTQRAGQRCSSARAYLHPVIRRANLKVMTRSVAQRVLFDNGRAKGVAVSRGRRTWHLQADKEVILAGGAIASPQLLMLSGVGPASHLREMGIDVLSDSPNMGQNLQDHLDICTLNQCSQRITYDRANEGLAFLDYLFRSRGMVTSNIAEAGGFVRSKYAGDERPDIQLHFVPVLLDDHGRNKLPGDGYTLHACALRPESRGDILLASKDVNDAPRIRANYLDSDYDRKMMLECVRISREIFADSAFDAYRSGEIYPGEGLDSEDQIMEFIRRKAETIYHPVGTCRMGTDEGSVVDSKLRVRGVDGLRVVDASIMPQLISGNTNAPVMMIAEKAAEMIASG